MGAAAYTRLLGLGPVQLYDAQGNHFDRHVVTQRLAGALRAWDGGVIPAQPRRPTLGGIENGYQELRRTLGVGLRSSW
eukprot:5465084-Lingulodinium_polyedra.AAC.1